MGISKSKIKIWEPDFLLKISGVILVTGLLVVLVWILSQIFFNGKDFISVHLLTNFPSRFSAKAGIYPALIGSLCLVTLTALIAIPLSILSAAYLEELACKSVWVDRLKANLFNLAAVPSVVYGILGLAIFVRWLQLDRSLLAGALTLTLVILPLLIATAAEAFRSVPKEMRMNAFALGATPLQTFFSHTLPAAFPGVLTGILLALARAFGETAPLIVVGALTSVTYLPSSIMDEFSILPLQVFTWAQLPQADMQSLASAGMWVLLCLSLLLAAGGLVLRFKLQQRGQL